MEGVKVVDGKYQYEDKEGVAYEWDEQRQAWFPMVLLHFSSLIHSLSFSIFFFSFVLFSFFVFCVYFLQDIPSFIPNTLIQFVISDIYIDYK